MRRLLLMLATLSIVAVSQADDQVRPPVDYQSVRVTITNICVRALETELVWLSGDSIKSKYGFSDAEMTELLSDASR